MRGVFLMITKMLEYWFIDLLNVIKLFYPPLIDENAIFIYAGSFYMTVIMIFGTIIEVIREFFKEERHFDFVYAHMGIIAIYYLLGAIGPYALEFFPPFG